MTLLSVIGSSLGVGVPKLILVALDLKVLNLKTKLLLPPQGLYLCLALAAHLLLKDLASQGLPACTSRAVPMGFGILLREPRGLYY